MRRLIVNTDDDRFTEKVIEKHVVLIEVREFDDPHLEKTRCLQIIKKLLYLLNQGETFTKSEAANILSYSINMYRLQDVHLRRMFHLIARDLCPIADEVPLITSSLLKDVNTGNVAYRANAIRLLRHITNDTSLSQVRKFLDEALRDDNPILQIASLVCAINLVKRDPRMAKLRVYPKSTCYEKRKHVQFHAIYLKFVMGPEWRKQCIISETSYVYYTYISGGCFSGHSCWYSSPLGPCILARGIAQDAKARRIPEKYNRDKYILFCIRDKDELVAIEGFRSLARVVGISISDVKSAIDAMRRILHVSHRPVVRFSAVRALHKVGMVHKLVWTTPEDQIAIGLDANVYKLHMEQVEHRDREAEAEQASRVIKSRSCSYNMHDGEPEAEQLSESFPVEEPKTHLISFLSKLTSKSSNHSGST